MSTTEMSRRNFLKGTGATLAGLGLLGATGCAPRQVATANTGENASAEAPAAVEVPEAANEAVFASGPISAANVTWNQEADIVVCGCGTAGCAAAVEAADAGLSTLVIEKNNWPGGQLRRCGGGVAAAGTQVQKALGVEDDPEKFFEFWMAACEGLADEELVREVTTNSASVIDWLIDDLGAQPVNQWAMCGDNNGIEYDSGPGLNVGTPSMFETVGMDRVQRCHWFTKNDADPFIADGTVPLFPTAGGTGLWKVFEDAMAERGVEVLLSTPLMRLVTADGSNEVIGVVAYKDGAEYWIKASKGVLLAAGNWASNHEMFIKFTGSDYEPGGSGGLGLDMETENDGSGCKAAMAIGADVTYPSLFGVNKDGIPVSYGTGALKVDVDAQVLDVFGTPIPRLFAAGLNAGGCLVKEYPVCGSSVLRGLYYGRKAGKNIAGLDAWQ